MGITGLLPLLKPVIKSTRIDKYKNKKIAIDAFVWIHSIATHVSYELYNKIDTQNHIIIFEKKIAELTKSGITPIFVFDGDFLEAKSETAKARKATKIKNKEEVEKAIAEGDKYRARELMKRCVEITSKFIYDFMQSLNKLKIEFFIAPYEADAQMAYLDKINYVDCVMTEDSDLILYRCKNILFKYKGGIVDEFCLENIEKCKSTFFAKNLLTIAILSGCDYLPSIKGIGLSTAEKQLEKSCGNLKEFINCVKMMKNKVVEEDYYDQVEKTKKTFLHHIVYDPIQTKRVHFTEATEDVSYLGTLENIKYTVKYDDELKLEIGRHFINGKEVTDDVETLKLNDDLDENKTNEVIVLEDSEEKVKKVRRIKEQTSSVVDFDTEKDITFLRSDRK